MDAYDHLVHVDAKTLELSIYRIDADGARTLYTSVKLPASRGWTPELDSFAKQLGENLLLDSIAARYVLGL